MRLRVATLNVWALPWPVSRDVGRRMEAIADHLPALSADAVGFQEVWTQGARETLVNGARRAGLSHVWSPESTLGSSGLLVVAKRTIESARFESYVLRGLPERVWHGDYYAGKGFVELSLDTPAGRLTLIDTHLHAQYATDAGDLYRGHRVGQAVQLAARVGEIAGPIVAAGDFNLREGRPEYRVLRGLSGLRDAAGETDRREPTALATNPYRRRRGQLDRRIDFVFVRDGRERVVRVHAVSRVFDEPLSLNGRRGAYSDHAGVMADLSIENRATGAPAVDPAALVLARSHLAEGRARAVRRRGDQRAAAAVGGGLGACALVVARRPALTRRRLLRGSLRAGGLLALPAALGLAGSSELAVPAELEAFDRVEGILDTLARRHGSRLAPGQDLPPAG